MERRELLTELGGVVRMQVSAQPMHISLVRLVTTNVAAQLDFDVESIAELEMAVDKACGQLAGAAASHAGLWCELRSRTSVIELSTWAPGPHAALHDGTFGWRLLREFTDEAESLRGGAARPATSTGQPEGWLGIRLLRRDTPG